MVKTAKDAAGEAVSENANQQATQQSIALVETKEGDVSGPLQLALSQSMQDQLTIEFQEALHQVESGFGVLTAPTEVAAMQTPFYVIDAITINDYEDRSKGEILVKHIFKLELQDGRILHVMQGDARPRRVLASLFQKARAVGARLEVGPYLYEKKPIPGQINPAWIFAQQPGFKANAS